MNRSEYEILSQVEVDVPNEHVFKIRSTQEQLANDLLIQIQHARTARPETKHTHETAELYST